MTASRIQGPVNLGPGNMIMGCLARNANKPWDPGKQLPLGFSASRQIKKKIKHKLQATGVSLIIYPLSANAGERWTPARLHPIYDQASVNGPNASSKQQANYFVDAGCGT